MPLFRRNPRTPFSPRKLTYGMERVSIIEGDTSVLLVVPYGANEQNVARMGEILAHDIGAYAVINRGWKRSPSVDHARDMADCNDLRHLYEDVVREEFLNPILRTVVRMKNRFDDHVLVLILIEVDRDTRAGTDDEILDIVLGCGAGHPPAHSCSRRTKNSLMYFLQSEGFGVYEGGAGSKYSGKAKKNLNQFFVRWQPDDRVESMQVAMTGDLIEDEGMIRMTTEGLMSAIELFRAMDDEDETPAPEVKTI